MAAVASNYRPEGSGGAESDQFTESGPSFTAVNGASTTPPVKVKPAQEPPKEAGDETHPRPAARPSSQQERPKSPSPSRQLHANSHQERERTPASKQVMDRSGPIPNHQENSEEPKNHYNSRPETPSEPSRAANGSPRKRKRPYPEPYENPNGSVYHTHEMPPSSEKQRMYGTDNGRHPETVSPVEPYARPEAYGRPDMDGPPDPYMRPEQVPHPSDPYARPEHVHASDPYPRHERAPQPELYPRPDRHQLVRNEYDPRGDPSLPPQRDQPYYSEARMAQALQNYESMPTRENYVSPEDEDEHGQQYGDYGNRSSQSAMEQDRKRRKRVFSNRTKTGCMTCRRRKKKCDEQHPECEYKSSILLLHLFLPSTVLIATPHSIGWLVRRL